MTETERNFAPVPLSEAAKLSGLETLQKILSGEFPARMSASGMGKSVSNGSSAAVWCK